MHENFYVVLRRFGPFCGLALVAVVTLITQENSAWADPMRRLTRAGSQSSQPYNLLIWLKMGGAVVAACASYGLAFSNAGVFSRALYRGSKPLSAYGTAWSVFFFACTVCTIAIFFSDLLPAEHTDRTPWLKMYWRHVVVAIIGTALAVLSLYLFRSPVDE